MANPVLRIGEEDGKFAIMDDEGTNYGVYKTREQAEDALRDWVAYYDAPLVF